MTAIIGCALTRTSRHAGARRDRATPVPTAGYRAATNNGLRTAVGAAPVHVCQGCTALRPISANIRRYAAPVRTGTARHRSRAGSISASHDLDAGIRIGEGLHGGSPAVPARRRHASDALAAPLLVDASLRCHPSATRSNGG